MEKLLRPVESRLVVLTDWAEGKGLMKPAGAGWTLDWLVVPSSTRACRDAQGGRLGGRSKEVVRLCVPVGFDSGGTPWCGVTNRRLSMDQRMLGAGSIARPGVTAVLPYLAADGRRLDAA